MMNTRIAALPITFALMAGIFGIPSTAHGQETDMPSERLKVGDPAPDFEIPSTVPIPSDGSTVSVRALTEEGQAVVIAFFPKAFTGG